MPSATPFITAHPCPTFAASVGHGYTFDYTLAVGPPRTLVVRARLGNAIVAEADFFEDLSMFGPPTEAHNNNVMVTPSNQRKKIATSMYVLAELILGLKLWNFWDGDPHQSPGGIALWAQPNRPFG